MERRHPKPDPAKVRAEYAKSAYSAFAASKGIAKTFDQLDAESKEAWMQASDAVASTLLVKLEEEETMLFMLKLAMRDALVEDHITQLVLQFAGPGGLPGKVRLLVAPERISMPFGAPLRGKVD